MLMVVVTCDGKIKGGKVGGVGVPWVVGGHEELGDRRIVKKFISRWLSSIKVGDGSQAVKGNDKLGTGGDSGMRIKGALISRQIT